MLKVEIDGKNHDLPNEWGDATMGQLLKSQELISEMPSNLYKHTFHDKKKAKPKKIQPDDKEVWAFYLKWVEFWVDAPDIKKIRRSDLKLAYQILSIYMFTPKEMEYSKTMKFKGTYYELPSAQELANGRMKYMADSTYEEWVEGVQLTSQLARMERGDLTVLPVLTATFYRPRQRRLKNFMRATVEPYTEESVKERAELFMDLPMTHVWGAYFFLTTHLERLLNGLQTSSKGKEQVAKKSGATVGT